VREVEKTVRLSVIIPAFNERSTILELLRRVCDVPIDKEVVVIDDGSTDGTAEELFQLGLAAAGDRVTRMGSTGATNALRLLVHQPNQGKGASIRDGIAAATGDVLLIQDADLEYDPSEYSKLLQPILDGKADAVYGSRFTGSPRRVLFFWHAVGNHLLTFLSNMFTNLNLTDMETGYKVFRAEVVKGIPLRSKRFGIEPELTAKLARTRARIYEVPISYAGRSYLEGKKIGWRDGMAAVWTILRYAVIDDRENAHPGYKTLQRVEVLHRYNAWMWEKVAPYVGDRVLEVGAGTGNMTRYLSRRKLVVATDIDARYVVMLRHTFANDTHVRVCQFDLGADNLPDGVGSDFDTVLCLNVLEHIEDDLGALRRIRDVLGDQGRVVLVVPALRQLYGEIDRAIGHHRRYDRAELTDKLQRAGFAVEHTAAFNAIGALGWYVNARLLRRRSVPGVQARVNDWLVPLLRLEDRIHCTRGLSLLLVGRRTD
jgi:glycosyltransferase involved in cell wall biosynthesis